MNLVEPNIVNLNGQVIRVNSDFNLNKWYLSFLHTKCPYVVDARRTYLAILAIPWAALNVLRVGNVKQTNKVTN